MQPEMPDQPAADGEAMPPPNPMVTLTLTEEQRAKWRKDIAAARTKRQIFEPMWQKNLDAYAPSPTDSGWGNEVNPGVDFYATEQKKAQLFFDTPEVILKPTAMAPPEAAQAIAAQQARLNHLLSRDGVDAKRLMDRQIMTILCPAGMGCSKVGVTVITQDAPDPTQPGAMMAVPVYRKVFWEDFSPKQVLIPASFRSAQFDKAPWLGVDFTLPLRVARRQFLLPPDFSPKRSDPKQQYFEQTGVPMETADDEEITGQEIWYQGAVFDDTVSHPEVYHQLVWVDGVDDPVVHRPSPDQTLENGVLTPDSMKGNPINIATIRDLPDSAYVPSDSAMRRPLVNEISRFRTQMIEHRDSSTSIRLGNGGVLTPEVLKNVIRGPYGTLIIIPESAYDITRPPVMEIAHPVMSRENFEAQEIIERDLGRIDALGANQTGAKQEGDVSATESTYIQRSTDVRLQAERNRVIAGFLTAVAKLDALLRRYPEQIGAAPTPLPPYLYEIKPDSGVHVDVAADRKFAMDVYNFLAKAPNVDHDALLVELLPMMHLPASLVKPPPPPGPPPPKTSVIVRGEDLSPLAPQYANVVEVLKQQGVTLTQTTITPDLVSNAALTKAAKKPAAPPQHGGAANKAELVNKHQADESGDLQGMGGQAGPH